jgi:hypothetical protein
MFASKSYPGYAELMEQQIRHDLIEALQALSEAAPSMRIGQLLAAAREVCSDLHGRGLWDAEDAELAEAVWKLQQDLKASAPVEVHPKNS